MCAIAEPDDAKQDVLSQVCDTLSDEVEIARAAEQLATMFVDNATMEANAPAAAVRPPRGIGAMDLLPLRVLLTQHVRTLTDLFEKLNAL
jgi:hypothetical protein